MGICICCTKKQTIYNVPATKQPDQAENETVIYRNPLSINKPDLNKLDLEQDNVYNMQDLIIRNFKEIPKCNFLGERRLNPQGIRQKSFTFYKWSDMETITKDLGSGINHLNLAPTLEEYKDFKMRFIGIYAGNIQEWVFTDITAALYGFTTIPMFDELTPEQSHYIFEKTNVQTLFISCEHIADVIKMTESKNPAYACIKNIVVINDHKFNDDSDCQLADGEHQRFSNDYNDGYQKLRACGLNCYKWTNVIDAGRQYPLEYPKIDQNQIHTLYYTSGTTGTPKAAMLSHSNFLTVLSNDSK